MIIPLRYVDVSEKDIPEKIKKIVLNLKKDRRGLYIHGSVGTGKTHLIYAIAQMVREKEIVGKVRVYNSSDMLRQMRDAFNKSDPYDNADLFKELLEFRGLLIIDDIGAEKLSDWVLETFYLLVNKRYEEVMPTIFTSNLPLKDLAEKIGDRTVSRIVESCDIFEIKGEDKRIKKHKKV